MSALRVAAGREGIGSDMARTFPRHAPRRAGGRCLFKSIRQQRLSPGGFFETSRSTPRGWLGMPRPWAPPEGHARLSPRVETTVTLPGTTPGHLSRDKPRASRGRSLLAVGASVKFPGPRPGHAGQVSRAGWGCQGVRSSSPVPVLTEPSEGWAWQTTETWSIFAVLPRPGAKTDSRRSPVPEPRL